MAHRADNEQVKTESEENRFEFNVINSIAETVTTATTTTTNDNEEEGNWDFDCPSLAADNREYDQPVAMDSSAAAKSAVSGLADLENLHKTNCIQIFTNGCAEQHTSTDFSANDNSSDVPQEEDDWDFSGPSTTDFSNNNINQSTTIVEHGTDAEGFNFDRSSHSQEPDNDDTCADSFINQMSTMRKQKTCKNLRLLDDDHDDDSAALDEKSQNTVSIEDFIDVNPKPFDEIAKATEERFWTREDDKNVGNDPKESNTEFIVPFSQETNFVKEDIKSYSKPLEEPLKTTAKNMSANVEDKSQITFSKKGLKKIKSNAENEVQHIETKLSIEVSKRSPLKTTGNKSSSIAGSIVPATNEENVTPESSIQLNNTNITKSTRTSSNGHDKSSLNKQIKSGSKITDKHQNYDAKNVDETSEIDFVQSTSKKSKAMKGPTTDRKSTEHTDTSEHRVNGSLAKLLQESTPKSNHNTVAENIKNNKSSSAAKTTPTIPIQRQQKKKKAVNGHSVNASSTNIDNSTVAKKALGKSCSLVVWMLLLLFAVFLVILGVFYWSSSTETVWDT